ncbi:MAG: tetratricopeptide repeat protein [Chloracidobacterium sp.]|nr:tetratricopeptide repeat protein [Chloracidobacterium sp.]
MNALLFAIALVQATPDCGKHFAAGVQEYQRKDLNKALIAFRTATQCDPKMVNAYLAIADIYAERGNDGEALTALKQVLEIEPKNALALRAAADLYMRNDQHRMALPLLETLLTVTPKSAEVHADLAAAYAANADHKRAETEFRESLELQADYFPALAGLGNLLSRDGDDLTAAPLLRKAVKLKPQAYEGHFLLGSTLNRMGQFGEARTELELAVKFGGDKDPRVFYQLARAWGGLDKAAERRAALAKFSELAKKQNADEELQRKASAWIDEARELLQAGDLENAAARLELAREAKPGDASVLFRLAGLNFDLRRYAAAREYVQAAISLSPEIWLYHYLLGLVERGAKHLTEARASLETAAKLQSTEAPVFNALGEVLMELGERQAAIAAFENAVKLTPNDATFRQNLESAKSKR